MYGCFKRQNNAFVFFALPIIVLAVVLAYFPSLSVPFYLDDEGSIVFNKLIQEESLKPLMKSWQGNRFIGYFTFWANYQSSALELAPYHITNTIIHLLNFLLVYAFSMLLLNKFNSDSDNSEDHLNVSHRLWALLIASLWVLHPLNSQTVIYTVQRLASLATMFMLLTAVFYMKARTTKHSLSALAFWALVVISVICGIYTKQNYLTILVFLFFYELTSASLNVRKCLVQCLIWGTLTLMIVAPFFPEIIGKIDLYTRDFNATTRTNYFYTQALVLWDYVVRFVFPFQLQLEIGVTLKQSFEPVVALAMLGHISLMLFAYRIRRVVPLFFVGMLFFYCSHLVESSIIPIKDLAFEHRTYPGNIGLVIAVVALLKYALDSHKKILTNHAFIGAGIVVLLIVGTSLIYNRAMQWQDPLTFYEREVLLSPNHARANASYGNELMKLGRYSEAETYLKKSVDINKANGQLTAKGLTAYMTVLYQQQKFQQAAPVVMTALSHIHNPSDRSMLLSNLAVGYIYMGYCDFALGLLTQALSLQPNNADAQNNKAYCESKLGR